MVRQGLHVAVPTTPVPYDYLATRDHRVFARVAVRPMTSHISATATFSTRLPGPGLVDVLAAYCGCCDRVWFVPVDTEVGATVTLSITQPRSSQSKRIRWAADYEVIAPYLVATPEHPDIAPASPAALAAYPEPLTLF